MNKKKNIKKYLIFLLLVVIFLGVNFVYADTTTKLRFCDYAGVRRALKIVGIILTLVKIFVPLLLIITGMVNFFKAVTTGKDEDLKNSFKIMVKKMIAGLVVFIIPTLLDYAFDNLVGYSDPSFNQCTNCVFDTGNCNVNVTDPSIDG